MVKVTLGGIISTSIITAFTIATALIWKDIILEVITKLVPTGEQLFYKILVPTGLLTIACYPLLEHMFGISQKVEGGWMLYSILIGGILISSGYLPFLTIFNASAMGADGQVLIINKSQIVWVAEDN